MGSLGQSWGHLLAMWPAGRVSGDYPVGWRGVRELSAWLAGCPGIIRGCPGIIRQVSGNYPLGWRGVRELSGRCLLGHLGLTMGHLELTWAILGSSCGHVGSSWDMTGLSKDSQDKTQRGKLHGRQVITKCVRRLGENILFWLFVIICESIS